ncbi:glycosyltransferase [Pelagibacterales bacterium SAG-MED37]|nr:glycosyltransferase [Pelagibacterales bacterium SAG-MED37]
MNRRNIAIVWESITDGGVNSYLKYLLLSKIFLKFNIFIITNSTNDGAKYLQKDLKNFKNIKFIYFKSYYIKKKNFLERFINYFLKPIFFLKTIKTFDKIFENVKIDTLMCQCGNYGGFRSEQSAIFAAYKKNIKKILLVVHHKCDDYPIFFKTILKFINYKIGNKINYLVTVSKSTLKSIKKNSNLYNNNVNTKIIHNGVKVENFKNKNYLKNIFIKNKIKPYHTKIGILARISEDKGHDILIKSVSLLKKNLLKKTKILFIGRGNKTEILKLKRLIKKYNLDDNIIILNYLDINSQKILSSLDLLVSATKEFEGFGLSIAESVIVGTPVIATRVGGVQEFFNNDYGKLIESKNHFKLKLAIEDFDINKKKWIYNINKSRINFKKNFNNEVMARKYLSLINNKNDYLI